MSPDELCRQHSGHDATLRDHERRLTDCQHDHTALWDAVKDKVSMRLFIILVGIIVGNLGFQMAIFNSVKEIEKQVAVIKTEIKTNETAKKKTH